MASHFADYIEQYKKENDTTTDTNYDAASAEMNNMALLPVLEESIDPDEQEILAFLRHDQEEARVTSRQATALVHAELESNAATTKEQQQLIQKKMYQKYGIFGGIALILIVTFVIAVVVAENKNRITQQLSVACNFVLIPDLEICQSSTSILKSSNGTIPTEIGLLRNSPTWS